ncbi:MAG: hypothetical protein LBU87_00125, partial [Lactobacillales bacterium]|nr:hypothetical protein [Lactobacillales bacterium]
MKPVFTSELSKILSGFLSYISYRYPEVEYMLRPDKTTAGAGAKKRKDRSLAAQVFSNKRVTDYIEFDRAAVSLLCLQWLIRDDYDKFTHNQKKKIKLSKTSFRKLQRYVQDLVQTDEELESAIYATICNDMGKTKKVVAAYRKQIGHNDSDHDKIYSTLIEKRPELFPGIAHLSEKQKKYLIQGLKTNFNLGQLVQGENVPASLISIKKLSAPAKNLFILHSFLDIAGSSGHIDHNGSLVMNETMTRVFLIALDVLSKKITVQSYNEFLFKFGQIAGISVVNSETYALARLAALSRCYTKDEGKTIQKAWQKLSSITRAVLTKELRISGLKDETAILLYYAPAFIENLKNAYLKKSTQKMAKVDAFVLAFTKLAEVYQYV